MNLTEQCLPVPGCSPTNRGVTWTRVVSGGRVRSVTVSPTDPNELYYTTADQGLWYTSNLRAATPTFTRVASFPFAHPTRVFYNPYDVNEIWVTTFGNGMYVGRSDAANRFDIRLQQATANGETTMRLNYQVVAGTAPPFEIAFYRSTDRVFDAGDTLLDRVTINASSDLSEGVHTKNFAIGSGPGQIALPGAGAAETEGEYYVLVVADPLDLIQEDDTNATNEDNTVPFVGAYHPTGGNVYVHGTEGADTLAVAGVAGGKLELTLNGQIHTYSLESTPGVRARGHAGNDRVDFSALAGFDAPGTVQVIVWGNSGENSAYLTGSNGDDQTWLYPGWGRLRGTGFSVEVHQVARIHAFAGTGDNDIAYAYDSPGNDAFVGRPTYGYLTGAGYYNYVGNFDKVYVHATAGTSGGVGDQAYLYDSSGNDTFIARPTYAYLSGPNHYNHVSGFTRVNAFANAGNSGGLGDQAYFYDSAANDTLMSRPTHTYLMGPNYYNYAAGFNRVYAFANAGNTGGVGDQAYFWDSAGNDTLTARPTHTELTGPGLYSYAAGFTRTYAYAYGGDTGGVGDRAFLYDAAGNDTFVARPTFAYLTGPGVYSYAANFDRVYAYALAGDSGGTGDQAFLYDTPGNDTFVARPAFAYLSGPNLYSYTTGFDRVHAFASSGNAGGVGDQAYLYDSSGNDTLKAYPTYTYLTGANFYNYAAGFGKVYAFANAGDSGGTGDQAYLYDSSGNDSLYARPTHTYLSGTGFYNYAAGFDRVYAYANTGGNDDRAYLYDSSGSDRFYGRTNYGYLTGSGFYNFFRDFDRATAYSTSGGTDLLDVVTAPRAADHVDYLFSAVGNWI